MLKMLFCTPISINVKNPTYDFPELVLPELYKLPIVNVHTIQSWTGFTKQGAQNVIDRFMELDILELKDENVSYDRSFIYRRYVNIFSK